jgi:hypothetical protein
VVSLDGEIKEMGFFNPAGRGVENDSAQEWQSAVNTTNKMGNKVYLFGCYAGSTSNGASFALPICCFGFGKSSSQSQLFVWIHRLIFLESH